MKKIVKDESLKEERSLKLKMIKAIQTIKDELNSKKIKFKEDRGVFTIYTKGKEFFFQIDDGEEITDCWINLSEYKSFSLCDSYISIDELLMNLDEIIQDVHKLFKIKAKVEKKINEIEDIINNSDIHGLNIDDIYFDDLLFENIITATEN